MAHNTIGSAKIAGTARLQKAGIETPALDASLLLAAALNTSKTDIYTHPEKHITEAQMRRYELFLQRREGGECAAYVIGYKEFRRLKLHVTADTLVPRADTETLVEAVLDYIDGKTPQPKHLRLLDLCTGSGAVALALKQERPFLNVYASDISEAALQVAKQNAAEHSLEPVPKLGAGIAIARNGAIASIWDAERRPKTHPYWLFGGGLGARPTGR
ncbi:MAG: HemK family protein methyltransferase, partial [Spirochaetaceae bacterium]|nr:HemK family protein methyltransferase [Spirochaetaceae bacterium]